MLISRGLVIMSLLLASSCLRSTTFNCERDSDCEAAGAGAVCETSFGKLCSVTDSSCSAGRRFADNSGASSGQCVGETAEDAGIGSEPTIPPEALPSNCPASGYDVLPNSGPRGRKYKVLMTPASWSMQRDLCAGEQTFLAFPDGPAATSELAALKAAAGDLAWVGVTDQINEGSYQNSLNQPISAQTQALINTSGNPQNRDCLFINNASLQHEDCSVLKKAVCECVP
jgi:hypothetical protein